MNDPKTDKNSDTFTDEEIARRRDDVIRRMANTPPKPHSEMKVGKHKAKASAPAQKQVKVTPSKKPSKVKGR